MLDALEEAVRAVEHRTEAGFPAAINHRRECWAWPGGSIWRLGMEACPNRASLARELGALGHDVRLMPPACAKACVKRHNNDAADAEAICEAVTPATMRFVPIKSTGAQGVLMLRHRATGMYGGARNS